MKYVTPHLKFKTKSNLMFGNDYSDVTFKDLNLDEIEFLLHHDKEVKTFWPDDKIIIKINKNSNAIWLESINKKILALNNFAKNAYSINEKNNDYSTISYNYLASENKSDLK